MVLDRAKKQICRSCAPLISVFLIQEFREEKVLVSFNSVFVTEIFRGSFPGKTNFSCIFSDSDCILHKGVRINDLNQPCHVQSSEERSQSSFQELYLFI